MTPPMPRTGAVSLVIIVFGLTALAGCGSSSGPTTSTHQRVAESPQDPAHMPKSWKRRVDRQHGLQIGVPSGWKSRIAGRSLLMRSPDHLVALSLAASRGEAALSTPPAKFARRAFASLTGYRHDLVAGPVRSIGATPLDTASVRAQGVAKRGGVRQKVELVVLRRDHIVSYTAVIAANAKLAPHGEIDLARRILRTLRDRPPAQAARSGRSG